MKGERRLFYGWVLVGMSISVFAGVSGTVYYTFGVFLGPMVKDLEWSRGTTSVAFSLFSVVMGLSGPLVAVVIERFSLKRTLLTGHCLMVVGLLLLSRVTQVWHLLLIYGLLLGLAMSCGTYLSMTLLLGRWFVRRRSLAIGIGMAGSGLGAVVLAPVARYLVDIIGWRDTWLVMGAVAFTFAVLPTLFLARDRPEAMGLQPDGGPAPGVPDQSVARKRRAAYLTPVDWDTRSAFKTPALWLIAFVGCANTFALHMLTTHQVVHLEDVGIAPVAAAGAVGLMVAGSSGGRLLGGAIGQWFPLRYVAAVACAMQVAGIAILLFTRSQPFVYLYVFSFGPAYGSLVILFPSLVGAYFGMKNYARIFGALFAAVSVLTALSPTFAGYMFDTTRSYVVPFSTAMGLCALAAIAALLARPPRHPSALSQAPDAGG